MDVSAADRREENLVNWTTNTSRNNILQKSKVQNVK